MENIFLFHKDAEPNIQLLFWDKDYSDLSKFFVKSNVLLHQSLISVNQIFLFYLLACRGFFPLLP